MQEWKKIQIKNWLISYNRYEHLKERVVPTWDLFGKEGFSMK